METLLRIAQWSAWGLDNFDYMNVLSKLPSLDHYRHVQHRLDRGQALHSPLLVMNPPPSTASLAIPYDALAYTEGSDQFKASINPPHLRNSQLVTGNYSFRPGKGNPISEEPLPSFNLELASDLEHVRS